MDVMARPSWLLTPRTVLLRRHGRNKDDPFCDPVELAEGNPTYSVVCLPDGRESTVSTSDLAPYPPSHDENLDSPDTDSARPETDDDVRGVAVDEVVDGVRDEEVDEDSVLEKADSVPALPRRAGLPADVHPMTVVVLMTRDLNGGRLRRFVCCCLAALVACSLKR